MPRLAVIGHPVAHSRSPAMQNAALRALPAEGFAGVNVTVPHKTAAFALADASSEGAQRIGAANTLVFEAGQVQAHNTDAGGLIASLPRSPRGARTLVLGAGGAARAAAWALRAEGAAVDIWNRTEARAQQIHLELGGPDQAREAVDIEVRDLRAVVEFDQSDYELIVNTTAVGLHGEDPFVELPLRRDGFGPGAVVVDMVYGEGPSTLLRAAAAAGATAVDGIEILVQQGALSLRIWTGLEPPLDVMRAAAHGI